MRIAVIAGFAALLAGCAGLGDTGNDLAGSLPAVNGNERGGRITNGIKDVPAAMAAAQNHCAKFNKKAQIIQMKLPSEGGLIAFDCR